MSKPTKRILLVEDEAPIRSVLRQELEKNKLTVDEASNGEEGMGLAMAEHPDLIILDIMMPKMHGIEFLDRLQKDVWGKTVPVILLTNYADDPRVGQAVDAGRCELMEKEKVKLDEVAKKVKETLGLA